MMLLPFYANISLLLLSLLLLILLIVRIFLRQTVVFKCDDRFEGKTVVITGASSGIGQATAIELAKRGARVIMACRDRTRRDSAPFAVRSRSGNISVNFMYLDLANLDSVVQFAHEFFERESKLDILINNAAVLCDKEWTLDGLDMIMGVNVFGHFLLANLLLEKMKTNSDGTRIINMVCDAYKTGEIEMGTLDFGPKEDYNMYKVYASSKFIKVLLTAEMSRRFMCNGTSVFAVDPGNVSTHLYRNYPGWMGKILRTIGKLVFRNPEDGAQTVLHCAMTKNLEKHTGQYFYNCHRRDIDLRDYNEDFYRQLWDKLETVLKSKNFSLYLKDYVDD